MNGRLLRCPSASGGDGALRPTFDGCNRRKSPKGASDPLLRHLQGTVGSISIRAHGASRFLNRLRCAPSRTRT